MELLRNFLNQLIIGNQVEFNLVHAHLLDEGIVFNQNKPRRTRNESAMESEYCRLHNITLRAWGSPSQQDAEKDGREGCSQAEPFWQVAAA